MVPLVETAPFFQMNVDRSVSEDLDLDSSTPTSSQFRLSLLGGYSLHNSIMILFYGWLLLNLISSAFAQQVCNSGSKQPLCTDPRCKTCFAKSFASSHWAMCWSAKNSKSSREVYKKGRGEFQFDCKDCGHSSSLNPHDVEARGSGWCQFCSSKKLCSDESCQQCLQNSFASTSQARFWSPRNAKNPRDVSKKSRTPFEFTCEKCGHDFQQRPDRIQRHGSWCPFCSNRQLCKDDSCNLCAQKSFASLPRAKQWSLSNSKRPRDVFKQSSWKYEFDCDDCGHSFGAALSAVARGQWCPFCTDNRLCDDDACKTCFLRSFASSPQAKHWSHSNPKGPRDVHKTTASKFAFNCADCGHLFKLPLNKITHEGAWCMYCSHTRLCSDDKCPVCFERSFASSSKAAHWSKSNAERPRDTFKQSSKLFGFQCPQCRHEFKASPCTIEREQKSWCPFCARTKLCEDEACGLCFNNSFAGSSKAKFWSATNTERPRRIFRQSTRKFDFDCDQCGHTFEARLSTIAAQGSWCPYCGKQRLCTNQTCSVCHERSFASSPNVQMWSANNEKRPREVFKRSGAEFEFSCSNCSHSFRATPSSFPERGTGCPFCGRRRLCADDACKQCFDLSFASSPKAMLWSKNNTERPRDVFKHASARHEFDCSECGHTYPSSLNYMELHGSGCPFCANRRLCDDEACQECLHKSFASAAAAGQWSSDNTARPRFVFKRSRKEHLFECEGCSADFASSPYTVMRDGTSICPSCKEGVSQVQSIGSRPLPMLAKRRRHLPVLATVESPDRQ